MTNELKVRAMKVGDQNVLVGKLYRHNEILNIKSWREVGHLGAIDLGDTICVTENITNKDSSFMVGKDVISILSRGDNIEIETADGEILNISKV